MRRIKIGNMYYWIIFAICIIDLNFLFLIDCKKFHIGPIYYTDFVLFINLLIFISELLRTKFKIRVNIAMKLVVVALLLAITSAYAGYVTYSQSIIRGIAAQREWISWIFLIYPLYNWIKDKRITIRGLKKLLYILGGIYSTICITQFFLFEKIQFTYPMINVRYGSVRLYFDTVYLCFITGFLIDDIIISKKIKSKKIILVAMNLFIVVYVAKGRMTTIALVTSILLCLIFRRNKNLIRKISVYILVAIMSISFMSTKIAEDIFATVLGKSTVNDTLSVRDAGREYYINLVTESNVSFVIGCGVPNINNVRAQEITNPLWGQNKGTARFFLEDQGDLAVMVKYGALGLGVLTLLFISCFYMAYRVWKKTNRIAYMQFFLVEVISCLTLISSFYIESIIFPLYFCMLYFKFRQIN